MKRTVRHAILAGILSMSICFDVGAYTYSDGLNFNVGGFSTNINDEVKSNDGKYIKSYDEDVSIKKGGIYFNVFSNKLWINEFQLSTTADVAIDKTTVSVGSLSDNIGAITVISGHDFYGAIDAENISLVNNVDRDGDVSGVMLERRKKVNPNADSHRYFKLNANGTITVKDFQNGFDLSDASELEVSAANLKMSFDSNKFTRNKLARGIYLHSSQNEGADGYKYDSQMTINIKQDIDFTDLDTAVRVERNNNKLQVNAGNNINIKNENGSQYNAIEFDGEETGVDVNDTLNEASQATLQAGNNILIENYKTGINSVYSLYGKVNEKASLGSNITLRAGNQVKISNVTTGIYAAGYANKVNLANHEEATKKNNTNIILAKDQAIHAEENSAVLLDGKDR